MLTEIYLWLESRSGIPYNLEDEVVELMTDIVATDPYRWMMGIRNIIDLTKDAVDVVNDYDDQIPDDLPPARKIKSMIAEYARNNVRLIISNAFHVLGLSVPEIIPLAKLTTLWNMAVAMNGLVLELTENKDDEESNQKWFEKYNDNYVDIFTDNFEIAKQDLQMISTNIDSIRAFHAEDEEDEE